MSRDFKPSNPVQISDISGNQAIFISGVGQSVVLISGAGVRISGETVRIINATVDAPLITNFILTSSGSGGVALTSATSSYPFGITITNGGIGVSGAVLLGTSGSPPFASGGYPLGAGQSIQLNVSRPDMVRVYGLLSGVTVGWFGQLG